MSNYQKIQVEQGSQEWKEIRRKHLTASQAPVLFGQSPYQSRLQLFEEKLTGQEMAIDSFKANLFAKGHSAEAAARVWLSENMGLNFDPAVLVSTAHPDLLASLDGFAEDSKVIMEAKWMGAKNLSAAKEGHVQEHHKIQIQAQLLVSGAEKCIYFATGEDGSAVTMDITPESKYLDEIAEVAAKFMKDVRDGNTPDPVDSDYYVAEADPIFDELIAAKRLAYEAESNFERLRNQVLKKYENHRRVRYGNATIVKSIRKGAVAYAKVPELKGVNLDPYRGPASEIITLKVGKP